MPPRGKRTAVPRVPFALHIPKPLNDQLEQYIEHYADKGESKNSIIVKGLEVELDRRFAEIAKALHSRGELPPGTEEKKT